MIKTIEREDYNTGTAEFIGRNTYGYLGDFLYSDEALYRNKKGDYFLVGEGSPLTCYSEHVGQNCLRGGSKITPLSLEEAIEWVEDNLSVDDFVAIVSGVDE